MLKASNNCKLKSFGTENPDEVFYVVRRVGGGLFSMVSSVLCHLDIAERAGFIPIVDFDNFTTTYNDGKIDGTENAWEYYFQPVSNYSLDDVYKSKRVIFSDPGYPAGYPMSITHEKRLYDVYRKFMHLKPDVGGDIDAIFDRDFGQSKVLGIHFRGQEQRTAAGHWFPPTKKQMLRITRRTLEKHGFDRIFVVSEESDHVDFLKKYFGDLVFCTDSYRTYGVNAYHQYPRTRHRFLLGREILIDAMLLSRCAGLIACTSNVAEFARFVSHGGYEVQVMINNGPNASNPLIARYLWYIKSCLPESFGGFSSDLDAKNFIVSGR